MNAILKEIQVMGAHEKLQLVEDLWDMIEDDSVPIATPELAAELASRSAWVKDNPGHALSINQVASGLGVRL